MLAEQKKRNAWLSVIALLLAAALGLAAYVHLL
jgi:hypothetical protein